MPDYVLRGVDREGTRRTETVTAPSAQSALDGMKARRFTDVELLTSELDGAIRNEMLAHAAMEKLDVHERPAKPEPAWRARARQMLNKSLWALPAVAWIAIRRLNQVDVGPFDVVLACFAALPLAGPAVSYWLFDRPYQRLLEIRASGRWDDVLRAVDDIERRLVGKLIPKHELVLSRAGALVRLGRTREALRLIEAPESVDLDEWTYSVRVRDLFATAGDRGRARALIMRAVELAPERVLSQLSLCEFLIGPWGREEGDVVAARAALERAKQLPVAASERWMLPRMEGMVLVEEGRHSDALPALQSALAASATMAHNPIARVGDAILHAYLAVALAGNNDRDAARASAERARTVLAPFPEYAHLTARATAASQLHAR